MSTLVLNAGFEPLTVVTFRRALILVMAGKATVLSADEENPIRGITDDYDRPVVILLRHYVRLPREHRVPVTRRGVLRRDGNRCGYCGASATTIDHILPRSRGGRDTWENLVACCFKCNNAKGNRTPSEIGWSLRMTPQAPRGAYWLAKGLERSVPQWDEFLGYVA